MYSPDKHLCAVVRAAAAWRTACCGCVPSPAVLHDLLSSSSGVLCCVCSVFWVLMHSKKETVNVWV